MAIEGKDIDRMILSAQEELRALRIRLQVLEDLRRVADSKEPANPKASGLERVIDRTSPIDLLASDESTTIAEQVLVFLGESGGIAPLTIIVRSIKGDTSDSSRAVVASTLGRYIDKNKWFVRLEPGLYGLSKDGMAAYEELRSRKKLR